MIKSINESGILVDLEGLIQGLKFMGWNFTPEFLGTGTKPEDEELFLKCVSKFLKKRGSIFAATLEYCLQLNWSLKSSSLNRRFKLTRQKSSSLNRRFKLTHRKIAATQGHNRKQPANGRIRPSRELQSSYKGVIRPFQALQGMQGPYETITGLIRPLQAL